MQHIISNAVARYPRLNGTYKFDSGEMRSVKCDALDDGAAYDMSFIMTPDQAKQLHSLCMEAYNNAASMDSKKKWPEKPSNLPYKKGDDGEIIGKAKLKGAYGMEKTSPPRQVDAQRNKLPDDFMLTSGSKVNVAVTLVPYNTGSINGISLRLRAVQVLELAELQHGVDPFDAVSGGYTAAASPAEDDPFALPPASPAPATAAPQSASQTFDDEIPF